jgi:hypothetical protein
MPVSFKEFLNENPIAPQYGIYCPELKAWAATKTDWNRDPNAPDVMRFRDEAEVQQFMNDNAEVFMGKHQPQSFPRPFQSHMLGQ